MKIETVGQRYVKQQIDAEHDDVKAEEAEQDRGDRQCQHCGDNPLQCRQDRGFLCVQHAEDRDDPGCNGIIQLKKLRNQNGDDGRKSDFNGAMVQTHGRHSFLLG
ncbi:hypothetical protein SDC9_57088 [bioreactor metagenome]|uniref:Uncharacterized protein n=1 Tax=bioreactor metagenome TaxID=1076179 RepID=A0A644X9E2_9ZZZZ